MFLHYIIKNLVQEEVITYQIQIFFSEIIDLLNLQKSCNKQIISEINEAINNFHLSEKYMSSINLKQPEVLKFLFLFF